MRDRSRHPFMQSAPKSMSVVSTACMDTQQSLTTSTCPSGSRSKDQASKASLIGILCWGTQFVAFSLKVRSPYSKGPSPICTTRLPNRGA